LDFLGIGLILLTVSERLEFVRRDRLEIGLPGCGRGTEVEEGADVGFVGSCDWIAFVDKREED
jgi:hypothetical protein